MKEIQAHSKAMIRKLAPGHRTTIHMRYPSVRHRDLIAFRFFKDMAIGQVVDIGELDTNGWRPITLEGVNIDA